MNSFLNSCEIVLKSECKFNCVGKTFKTSVSGNSICLYKILPRAGNDIPSVKERRVNYLFNHLTPREFRLTFTEKEAQFLVWDKIYLVPFRYTNGIQTVPLGEIFFFNIYHGSVGFFVRRPGNVRVDEENGVFDMNWFSSFDKNIINGPGRVHVFL